MSTSATSDLNPSDGFSVKVRTTMPRVSLRRLTPLALLLPLAMSPAAARTYTLATTADDAVVNGNCTLREALRAARDNLVVDACLAGETADTIVLPAGTYPFVGEELFDLDTTLEIRGQGADPSAVTVDLSNAGRFLAFQGSGAGGTLVLRGFTVVNGDSTASGGAVSIHRYAVTLDRMRFIGNYTDEVGGAVFVASGLGGSLTASRTQFLANSARGEGGALWVTATAGTVQLRDLLFELNSVTAAGPYLDAWAGALYLDARGPVSAVVERCDFSGNSVTTSGTTTEHSAWAGGAYFGAAGGTIRVLDSTFVANAALVAAGTGPAQVPAFAAFADSGGRIYLERILVDASASSYANGSRDVGLWANSGGGVLLADAQVTFGSWNGIEAITDGSGAVEMVQVTAADYAGGYGIKLDTTTGGTIGLRNSLLALNASDVVSHGPGVLMAGNCIGMTGDFPGFVNVAGGNYRLNSTSAAIDAALIGWVWGSFDRDHAPRVVGVGPDCGAYERGGLFADGFEAGDTGIWSVTTGG
jgi:CSLREA domain-containing protein